MKKKSSFKDRKSNPAGSSKYSLGSTIQDIIQNLNLRIKPEDGKVKFEGSFNDLEFQGIADKEKIDMTGKYKGMDFNVSTTYKAFAENIASQIGKRLKGNAENIGMDKEQVHEVAKGILSAISQSGENGTEVAEAVEATAYSGGRTSYKEKMAYGGISGSIAQRIHNQNKKTAFEFIEKAKKLSGLDKEDVEVLKQAKSILEDNYAWGGSIWEKAKGLSRSAYEKTKELGRKGYEKGKEKLSQMQYRAAKKKAILVFQEAEKMKGLDKKEVKILKRAKDIIQDGLAEGGKLNRGGRTEYDKQVNEIVSGYISAILFAENDNDEESLDRNYDESDFAVKTRAAIEEMIGKYVKENKDAIEQSGLSNEIIGNDIWYAQKGHGAGFFDHSLDKDVEDKLTSAAKALGRFPEIEIDDEDKIHVRGVEKYKEGGPVELRKKIDLGKVDYDDRGRKVNEIELDVEIRNKDKARDWETLEELKNVPEVSMSGGVWNSRRTDMISAGQILDEFPKLFPGNKKLKRLVEIWKEYHLNDMKSGTKKQEEAVEKWEAAGNKYDYSKAKEHLETIGLDVDRGYEYGTGWLYKPVPDSILSEIKSLSEDLENKKTEGGGMREGGKAPKKISMKDAKEKFENHIAISIPYALTTMKDSVGKIQEYLATYQTNSGNEVINTTYAPADEEIRIITEKDYQIISPATEKQYDDFYNGLGKEEDEEMKRGGKVKVGEYTFTGYDRWGGKINYNLLLKDKKGKKIIVPFRLLFDKDKNDRTEKPNEWEILRGNVYYPAPDDLGTIRSMSVLKSDFDEENVKEAEKIIKAAFKEFSKTPAREIVDTSMKKDFPELKEAGGSMAGGGKVISSERAKEVASNWHGGQNSALYQYSSSGVYLPENHLRYLQEVQQSLDYPEQAPHPYDLAKKDERELNSLKRFFEYKGEENGIKTEWHKHSTYGYPIPYVSKETPDKIANKIITLKYMAKQGGALSLGLIGDLKSSIPDLQKKSWAEVYKYDKDKYVIALRRLGYPASFTEKSFSDLSDAIEASKKLINTDQEMGRGGNTFVPKSSQVKKLGQQIEALEKSLNTDIINQMPEEKAKMEKSLKALKAQYDDLSKKVSTKEKIALEKGKFYLTVPSEYKEPLYQKLRNMGIKVKWSELNGTTKAIANSQKKRNRIYSAYASILKKANKEVPELETISGKH